MAAAAADAANNRYYNIIKFTTTGENLFEKRENEQPRYLKPVSREDLWLGLRLWVEIAYMSRLKKRKIERVIPGDMLNFGLKNNLSITVNF